MEDWQLFVGVVGAVLAAATLAVEVHKARRRRPEVPHAVDEFVTAKRPELINRAAEICDGHVLRPNTPLPSPEHLVDSAVETVRKNHAHDKMTTTEWTLRITRIVSEQVHTAERETTTSPDTAEPAVEGRDG